MSRKWWSGLAVAAAVFAVTALAAVQSSRNAGAKAPAGTDLTGSWVLDASRSDLPGFGGRGRSGGPDGPAEGRWRGRRGEGPGGGGPRAEGRRGRRMPRVMRVTQGDGVVSFADSTGATFEVIRVGGGAPAGSPGEGVRELTGRWEDGTLIAQGSGPRGGAVVRTFVLSDAGRTLEVRTERKRSRDGGPEGFGQGPRRSNRGEMRLVYRRTS